VSPETAADFAVLAKQRDAGDDLPAPVRHQTAGRNLYGANLMLARRAGPWPVWVVPATGGPCLVLADTVRGNLPALACASERNARDGQLFVVEESESTSARTVVGLVPDRVSGVNGYYANETAVALQLHDNVYVAHDNVTRVALNYDHPSRRVWLRP
jgi:hypothetical protein